MANSKTPVLVVVGLLVGVVAGYGVGFIVTRPQIAQLESDLSDTETALSASQSEVESLQAQLSDAETQITNLTSNLAEARATIADYETQISNLESDLANARDTITGYEGQISSLELQVGELLSRITPRSGCERLLDFGFSFEYPKWMDVSLSGLLSDYGADEHSGSILAQVPDETEFMFLVWNDDVYPRNLDEALDDSLADYLLTYTGDRVTSTTNGHTIKYQDFTFVFAGESYNGVHSYWNCDITQRTYGFGYFTIEEDVLTLFQQYLDSFMCH